LFIRAGEDAFEALMDERAWVAIEHVQSVVTIN